MKSSDRTVFSDNSLFTLHLIVDVNSHLAQLHPYPFEKLRALFAYAADCEPDPQGRILLPAKLREYAGLTKEVVVVGSFDRVEIWNAQRWAEIENEAFSSGALEEAMAEMGL